MRAGIAHTVGMFLTVSTGSILVLVNLTRALFGPPAPPEQIIAPIAFGFATLLAAWWFEASRPPKTAHATAVDDLRRVFRSMELFPVVYLNRGRGQSVFKVRQHWTHVLFRGHSLVIRPTTSDEQLAALQPGESVELAYLQFDFPPLRNPQSRVHREMVTRTGNVVARSGPCAYLPSQPASLHAMRLACTLFGGSIQTFPTATTVKDVR